MSVERCRNIYADGGEQCTLLQGHGGRCYMLTRTGYTWDVDEMRVLISELARSWCARIAPKWAVKGAVCHLNRAMSGEYDELVAQARQALCNHA